LRSFSLVTGKLCNFFWQKLLIKVDKLTIGVNSINILRVAFALADPDNAKKTDNLTVFFALLGYAGVKAARRTLMKLTDPFL